MILRNKKVGYLVCLFLLLPVFVQANEEWNFDPELRKAYLLVLNLQTEQAALQLEKLKGKTNPLHLLYVQSLRETLDVLISEDDKKFDEVEKNFAERFKFLENQRVSAETLFLQAELHLQRGFNFLNLGHEISSIWAIRTAYNFTQECLQKYPNFIPIKKTSGVIQVMVGSVPDKYHWFISLLGMSGSVTLGQRQLETLKSSTSSLALEASILYYTIKGLINQQHAEASVGIMTNLKSEPENRLLLFLGVNMLIKNSQSEEALQLIQTLDTQDKGLPMYYIEYLRGEILLQKGMYSQSIAAYQKFIKSYKSQNFKKDSYFKISLCYLLDSKESLAKQNFEIAKKTGKNVAEPDRYADAQLKEDIFPNKKLLKIRFYTDGGYFDQADEVFSNILLSELKTKKEKTEYYYRKARLAHKKGDIAAAKLFYQQTINLAGDDPWYFAPNSALQLGLIAEENKNNRQAREYYEKALSYKKHEYKNSIDGKAKSGLDRLTF